MRQALPVDPTLTLAPTRPAPIVTSAPPVVTPRRRRAPERVPELFPELVPEIVPELVPELVPSPVLDAPAPERNFAPVQLWSDPVPVFTYLAGAAGSGKTFATREWAEREAGLLLCATTGIAAINLGGETINSVLSYFDTTNLQEAHINGNLTSRLGSLWKAGIRRLILDEVSMLSGDQLSFLVRSIEEVNSYEYVRKKNVVNERGEDAQLGLTLVGDFLQLPPVKAPFAFESPEWDRFAPHVRTLREIRRQADADFIEILRAARVGEGAKVAAFFEEHKLIQFETDDQFTGPTILARNDAVDRYNGLKLSRLATPAVRFGSTRWGKQRSEWGNPDKAKETWGIPETLLLKEGALVMVLANRRQDRQLLYVNGDLGTLIDAQDETAFYTPDGEPVRYRVAHVQLHRTGQIVSVWPVERKVKIPCDSARRKELRQHGLEDRIDDRWEIAGAITYMPLRVAYATTVHKSQGLSLDAVQINVRDHFFKTPGMLYVALSRARTLGGLRVVGSRAALAECATVNPRLEPWQ